MTETEAKTKWCPIIMHGGSITGALDAMPMRSRAHGANCIASACMLWRVSNWAEKGGEHSGYCGLAGKP